MTEGCQGGWGIMNGFFSENVGLVKEDCAPYKGSENQCSAYKHCEEKARVTKTYFVEDMSETGI